MAIAEELQIIVDAKVSQAVRDLQRVDKSIDNTSKSTSKLKDTFKALAGPVAIGAVIIGLGRMASATIKAASNAEETNNKFKVVFKDISKESQIAATNLSKNFGLSSNAAKTLLSDTGDLLTGFGFTGKSALDLSTQVNELAVDLASFTNFSGGAEGASAALTKALLGERESVKSLGISILDADVKAKVFELTQKGMVFETERQAKAIATLTIAQEQSKNAIGDFERSSASFANQTRITKARIEDLQVVIGDKLLPVANVGVGLFNDMLVSATGAAEGVGDFVDSAEGIEAISDTFAVMAGIFEVLKTFVTSLFEPLGEAILRIVSPLGDLKTETEGVSAAFSIMGTSTQLITGALEIYSTLVGGAVENTVNLVNTIRAAAGVIGSFFGLITGETSLEEFKQSIADTKDAFFNFGSELVGNSAELFNVMVDNVLNFSAEAKKGAELYAEAYTTAAETVKDSVTASLTAAPEAQKQIEQAEEFGEVLVANKQTHAEMVAEAMFDLRAYGTVTKEVLEMTTEKWSSFAGNVLGSMSNMFSAIAQLQSTNTSNEIAELDKQLEARLEAAGLAEETTQERLDRELAAAQVAGDSEAILAAEAASARNKTIEEFEKKKAQEEYKGALASWKLSVAGAAATGAQAILSGFASKPFLPVGLAMGALATGAAGVQQAAVKAAKPSPAFAEGGSFLTQGAQTIQVGDNAGGVERVTVEPLSSTGANTDKAKSGGSMILNIDGNQFTGWLESQFENGRIRVARRAIV